MAPLRYEFGWGSEDWDHLAAGIIAGHILECGAQCSGGNCLYDWKNIPDLANVGYPIAEASADGTFYIVKHPNTGGRISVPSVTEQLVYEMGDPNSYITPDVVADFTTIHLEQAGENRVQSLRHQGPSRDGQAQGLHRVSLRLQSGRHARLLLARCLRQGEGRRSSPPRADREASDSSSITILTEFVGVNATHGPLAGEPHDPPGSSDSHRRPWRRPGRWSSASPASSHHSCSMVRRV